MPELKEDAAILEEVHVRLLIVEDEASLAQALQEGLDSHGFRSVTAHSVEEAWEALWHSAFDVILLDVMLPEGDEAGFSFAQGMRELQFRQPILFLTARERLPDRLRGLEVGDDYLAKPFALPELAARLKALYRRGDVRPRSVQWRSVELLCETRKVHRVGSLVRLTAKEYQVLELFMLNPGRIFTREEVLERIWGAGFDSPSNMVNVYIKNLRAKVDAEIIETVRGLGYRFSG